MKLKDHFRVAIFGSARIKKDDKNYKMIHNLAEKIGEQNMDVVTGGGPGIMEAASSGHKKGNVDHKSHSFGLLIKLPREQRSNHSLDIKKEFKYFSKRLDRFMELSNVVVVAPGGIGTLLELVYAWQLLQVKKKKGIPIILIGNQWKLLIQWMKQTQLKAKYIKKEDFDLVFPVKNIHEAMVIINDKYESYKK
ncbi:MAG: hypothetical protein CMH64_01100 [Nanoarchaeota archaeon]|nr:hypothetical protein [Nanoarchaeota archaeon]|tara:strand:+ start:104 stop:682 length:579 start_codon:yes stop_codon:yes gene_type:complete